MRGEGHIDVFLTVPLQLLDLPQPGDVGVDGVHREPHQLSIESLELVDHGAEVINSVVQTGVKSAGWEKRITHLPA